MNISDSIIFEDALKAAPYNIRRDFDIEATIWVLDAH